MYIHTQKEKKKGFGSGDFRRKDEFSNTIRTGQYRHQLDVSAFFIPSPSLSECECVATWTDAASDCRTRVCAARAEVL